MAAASDREKWRKIYNALKFGLCKLQSQLDSLEREKNYLENCNKISDAQISKLRRQLAMAELQTLVEVSKADLFHGFEKREGLVNKQKLEEAVSELQDFRAWFDILRHRCPDQEEISPKKMHEILQKNSGKDSISKRTSKTHCKTLEDELTKLKREYEKLSVRSSSDKSAFEDKINFVWTQYEEMENKYTDKVDKANQKISKLIESLEQSQSSNTKKDEKINTLEAEVNKRDGEISRLQKELESLTSTRKFGEPILKYCGSSSSYPKTRSASTTRTKRAPETDLTLRDRISKLEAEAEEKKGEISKMSKELELLRSKSVAVTPISKEGEPLSSRLRRPRNKAVTSSVELAVTREQGGSSRLSKRKQSDVDTEETPKLFTKQFKVPKLKSQSPRGR